MADIYSNMGTGLESPYVGGFAISPSNSADLAQTTRAIYVGGAGDVTVTMLQGGNVTLQAVPVGTLLPVRATRVLSTGTTATKMTGLY